MNRREFDRRAFLALAVGTTAWVLDGCRSGSDSPLRIDPQKEARRLERIQRFIAEKGSIEELPRESDLIGGVWVAPTQRVSQEDDILALTARTPTAETRPDAPDVKYVVFTADYPGRKSPDPANPNGWDILDVVERPHPADPNNSSSTLFSTSFDLRRLNLPPRSPIRISFDVVNVENKMKEAPHGVRDVLFAK